MHRRDFVAAATVPLALGRGLPRLWPVRARPTPSPSQLAWQRDELALFLHFGVNTFTDREWGDGTEAPTIFNPAGLDARQWARAAVSAGFRTLILTAKHHDGFCLWPSKLTTHSVASSPWREGRGDVVRELADACSAHGLTMGLYLSPWDRHEPSYGDSPRYNDFYIGQLTELLTQYGPVREVWFDGANGEGPNGKRQIYDWERIYRTVRSLQPEAVIFSDAGPDIRWIGNEKGTAGDPNWSTMDPGAVPYPGADGPYIISALQHGDPSGSVWRPGEADVSIRPGWFYHSAEDGQVRTAENLMDLYCSSVGRNAGLLLNVPPNRDGLLSAPDVAALAEFGARLRRAFEHDLAEPARVTRDAASITLQLGTTPVSFNCAVIEEDITQGQNVSGHRIIATDGSGVDVIDGTTVGYRRIHRFPTIFASTVTLEIRRTVEAPKISRFALYKIP